MPPYRILEHTADIGFEAFGATCAEAFANAGRALFSILVDPAAVEPQEKLEISAEGSGPPELLVNWLSELLFLQDAEGWLFREFEVSSFSDQSIRAVGIGEKFNSTRHKINLLVKAITYHQLVLEETAGGWRAQVYVDI